MAVPGTPRVNTASPMQPHRLSFAAMSGKGRFMQARLRRQLVLGASVLTIVLVAAACGGSAATTKPVQSSAPTEAVASPSAAAVVDPVVWWVPSPDEIEGTSEGIAEFCSKETGIPINLELTPWDGYSTKLTTAITSGQVPDIAVLGNTDVPTLANTGAFMTWGDAELAAIGGADQFVGQSLNAYVPAGEQPASLPFIAGAWLLQYNKAIFEAAGISGPPTTWAEFYKIARQLSDPSKDQYGVAIAGGTPGAMSTWAWIVAQQNGVPYYSADGQPQVNTPAMVSAMTDLVSWVYPYQIMSPTSVADNSNGDNALFAAGKAAMDITQNPKAAINEPDKYGIGVIPLPDPLPAGGKPTMSHLAGLNLAIFKDGPNRAGALAVTKCLVGPTAQVMQAKGNIGLPVTVAGLQDPYFQTDSMQAYGKILANAAATPTEATSSQLLQGVGDALVKLYQTSAATKTVDPAEVERALKTVEETVKAGG